MKTLLQAVILTAIVLLPSGCDLVQSDDHEIAYALEAYLVANERLPEIRLSQVAPAYGPYRFEDYAVTDATIVVSLLTEQGVTEQTFAYRPVRPGVFEPLGEEAVLPLRRYAVEVVVHRDGSRLFSETFVPGPFEILSLNTDTLAYQRGDQLQANVSRSVYPGRQGIFTFTLVALDTLNYGLTPMYEAIVNEYDDATRSHFVRNNTGLVNEKNFEHNGGDYLSLKLPWVSIAFFGPNEIVAAAVDDNLYDFIRSADRGMTTPGQIENMIDHVQGGRGIFGSMARASTRVYVTP